METLIILATTYGGTLSKPGRFELLLGVVASPLVDGRCGASPIAISTRNLLCLMRQLMYRMLPQPLFSCIFPHYTYVPSVVAVFNLRGKLKTGDPANSQVFTE